MFYEENKIIDILKCRKCKERLDSEPKMLPCGQTVCSHCLNLICVNYNKFKCIICDNEHTMPENGLPINIAIQELSSKQPKEVYRSQAVEKLKKALNDIRKNKNLLQNASSNSIDRIKEQCIELRNKVQLATEQVIIQISDLNDQFIKEINQYEEETIQSYQPSNVYKDEIIEKIKELDSFHTTWSEYLKQTKIDDEKIATSNTEAVKLNKNAKQKLLILDSTIFSKGLMKFTKNENNKIDKSMIGSFNLQGFII